MEEFTISKNNNRVEYPLLIYDSNLSYYGGDQHWYPRKTHSVSGCGPVAAANITAYLAQTFPEKYYPLYPYTIPFQKQDFISHMIEIRKYVKPGMFGLTSVQQFSDNVLSFAAEKGITLVPSILDDHSVSMEEALKFIVQGLAAKIPVAILILKHPIKELIEYTWHWMTITGLKINPTDQKYSIIVSSYGKRHEINFNLLWNHRRSHDIINLAYFS